MHELTPTTAAASPDPYPYYASLVMQRPFHRDDDLGLWIAASARAVEAVLGSDAMRVRPLCEPVPAVIAGTPAGDLFGRFMRMTDGPYHAARKHEAVLALDSWACGDLDSWARECARIFPQRDLASFMHRFPAFAMSHMLGLRGTDALKAADAAVDFARSLSNAAADVLLSSFAALGQDARIADAIGFLFQSVDATAGLIGNTLLALRGAPQTPLAQLVTHVARHDSPVQNTRRFAARDVTILENRVLEGDAVLVLIAAANRDPQSRRSYTFGVGEHACPGERIACALTAAAVSVIQAEFGVQSLHLAGYRPSANVRIPEFER